MILPTAIVLFLLALSTLFSVETADAAAFRSLEGFTTNTLPLPANDDESTGEVSLGFTVNFFGLTFTTVFVNNNGNVTFGAPLRDFIPFDLTSTQRRIIAPFFADVDTRGSGSGIVTYGNDVVNGRAAFGVNWFGVGYFSQKADKLNTFQLVLIDRSDTGLDNFDIEFNYDRIEWETGEFDSGGSGGLGGASARVGYSNGSGAPETFFELPGSGMPGSFLDSNIETGLIHGKQNSEVTGRYVFFASGGMVLPPSAPLLEVTTVGSGSGHVSSVPAGIDCGSDCRQLYPFGTVVTLNAVAAPGSIFAGWAGACNGFDPCVVTVETATAVIATFQPPAAPVPFRQPIQIGVSDSGTPPPTSSYPSIIPVRPPAVTAGVNFAGTGRIRKVTVTLNGLTHTRPADLDILLEGPTGQTVLLMSDAGSGYRVSAANITFDDSAPALPDTDPLRSGTYRPTNHGRIGDRAFPDPAPVGPYATQLSAFNGTDPNGLWKLYVRDDLAGQTGTIVSGWTLTIATGPVATTAHDLDGDGKADVAIFRRTGDWFVRRSFDNRVLATAFGNPALGDLPVPADYDGDGIADIAVFRQSTGEWFIFGSSTSQLFTDRFGAPGFGDVPVPGDYDGDGRADLAVYRTTTGQWFIFGSSTGFPGPFPFGAPGFGDIAVPADYDGDGKMDVGIYRTTTGEWLVFGSTTGLIGPTLFGAPHLGDLPMPVDFDGDGRADFAVYRRTTGDWIIFGSSTGIREPVAFGNPAFGDVPAPADYDGDGKADLAIYRQINGDWVVFGSAMGFQHFTFGLPGLDDVPTLRQAVPPTPKPPPRPDAPPKEDVPEEVEEPPQRPAPICTSDPESLLPPECP